MSQPAIQIVEIVVHAEPGASLGACMQEAIKLAASEWRNVSLSHNGSEYGIEVNELYAAVKKREKP